MRKIRTDLIGVVLSAGRNFSAGEAVPDDVLVDDSLLEPAETAPEPAETAPEPAETAEEDYSDLLGGDDAEKPAPKAAPKAAPKRSTRKS